MTVKAKGLAYINKHYETKYKTGQTVRIKGQNGVIRGGREGFLAVLLEGEPKISYHHPVVGVQLVGELV